MTIRSKTEKMSVTIPRELAGEIRSIVPLGEVSSFFTEALEHYIALRKQRAALQKGYGAWKDSGHPGLNTPDDSTKYVHQLREADRNRLDRQGDRVAR